MTFKGFVVFICGLNNEYKVKTKTQYLKILEEAPKSAQNFDDMANERELSLSHTKLSASNFSLFKN